MTFKYTTLALAGLLCTHTALAREVLTSETLVVSASLAELELQHAQNSLSAVSQEEIITSGHDTVPVAIQDVPGVNLIADGTPGLNRVSLRGEGSSRTLVMVDGQRLDDQKNKSGVPFLVNPFFVERVEVVRGPSSVLFGSDALGGVVNIITLEPAAEPCLPELGIVYSSNGDGFSEFFNVSGTVERFKYALGVMHSDVGDLDLANGSSLDNSSYRQKGANIKLSYDFTDHLTAGVSYEYFNNANHTSTTTTNDYENFRANIPGWKRAKYSAYAELHDLSELLRKIKVSIYRQTNDKAFNSNLPITHVGSEVEVSAWTNNAQSGYGGNLQADLTLSEHFDLVAGYERRHEDIDSTNTFNVDTVTSSVNINVTGYFNDNDYMQQTDSVYALLSTYLSEQLTLNTGIRWNHISTGDGYSQRDTATQVSMGGIVLSDTTELIDSSYGKRTNVQTVASIGLVYDLLPSTTLRLHWSQGFRAPSIQELFLYTRTAEIQQGNPDLTPERSNNFELGIRHSTPGGLKLDGALFYSKADDYIATIMTGYESGSSGQEMYTFRNIDKSTSFGLEMEAGWEIARFYPYASLTWMRREYETPDKTTYYTGIPNFKGRAGLKFSDTHSVFDYYIDGYLRWASHNINENLDGSSYFDSVRLAGYVTYNLAVGVSFGNEQRFKIFAAAENLSNVTYRTSELIDEPGRFYVLGGQVAF